MFLVSKSYLPSGTGQAREFIPHSLSSRKSFQNEYPRDWSLYSASVLFFYPPGLWTTRFNLVTKISNNRTTELKKMESLHPPTHTTAISIKYSKSQRSRRMREKELSQGQEES